MFNVEDQIARVEQLYRQLTGSEPKRSDRPIAPIPPDAHPEQHVQQNLIRLQSALQSTAFAGQVPTIPARIAIFETEEEWRCAVELPGARRADVAVQIKDGVLRVSALRPLPGAETAPATPTYSEIVPCRYERAVPMPPFARCETAEARLENGVLLVKCAKDPAAHQRDVKIEVA